MGSDGADFALAQLLQQMVGKDQRALAFGKCIRKLALACGPDEQLFEWNIGALGEFEDRVMEFPRQNGLRNLVRETAMQAAQKYAERERCPHDKQCHWRLLCDESQAEQE